MNPKKSHTWLTLTRNKKKFYFKRLSFLAKFCTWKNFLLYFNTTISVQFFGLKVTISLLHFKISFHQRANTKEVMILKVLFRVQNFWLMLYPLPLCLQAEVQNGNQFSWTMEVTNFCDRANEEIPSVHETIRGNICRCNFSPQNARIFTEENFTFVTVYA